MRFGVAVFAWLAAVSACTDPAAPPAVDGGGDASDAAPMLALPPASPSFLPCPAGFREARATGLDVSFCDAWPESGREECDPWEAHLPGEPGCRPVGAPCPVSSRFATDLPAGTRIFHVDPAAPPGGDGTEAAPFDALDLALRDAGADQIIALAPGTYDAAPRLRSGVTLWGACAAETHISPTTTFGSQSAVSSAGSAVVRNLSISGARIAAGALDAGEELTLEGVWIEGSANYGVVAANGGRVTVRDAHLGSPDPVPGLSPQMVLAQNGGQVALTRVDIAGVRSAGVTSEDEGSVVTLSEVVVRNGIGTTTGEGGRGLTAQLGGRVEARSSVLDDLAEVGALSKGMGSSMLLEDTVVRDTRAQPDGLFGRGVSVQDRASLVLNRVLVDGAEESGILALEAERLELNDVVVRNVAGSPLDGRFGVGVAVTDTPFAVSRLVVEGTRSAGVSIQGALAVGTLDDVGIRDVESELGRGLFGRGLNVYADANVTARRVAVGAVRDLGVFATYRARLAAEDLSVAGVRAQQCASTTCTDKPGGVGLGAYADAVVTLERFTIADNELAGAQLVASELDLRDGEILSNPIGVNVQVEGYDVERLSLRVRYLDNGVNLDAEGLPVPDLPEQPIGDGT